jgi:thiol-disulfide isomerase/thioredoxin
MHKLLYKLYTSSRVVKLITVAIAVGILWALFIKKNSTVENFGNPRTCTYYYMNECGHCKRFAPEWDNFVQSYTGPVTLRKVEMSEAGDDLEKYNIRGFPTILVVDDKGEFKDYDGPRTSEALTKFLAD